MLVYIIPIILLLIIILLTKSKSEFFSLSEEGLPNEYRFVNYPLIENPINIKALNNRIWELRFPSLVKQRYSFDDTRDPYINYIDLNEFARLKELSVKFNPKIKQPQISFPNNRKLRRISPYDYSNSTKIAFNAGPGTSDSFYLTDKGF